MTFPQKLLIWLLSFVLLTTAKSLCYAGTIDNKTDRHHRAFIFENVNVIPMDQEEVLYHHDVVVQGGKIADIYPTKSKKRSFAAKVIDGKNKWLIPGLADMHMHINPGWMSSYWPVNPLKLYLANGVTSIRCFGPDFDRETSTAYVFEWQRKIAGGQLTGPYIYSCGPILFGPVNNPRSEVLRQASAGYDFIKLYSYLTPEEFDEAIKAAKNAGIYVAGHIPMMVGLDSVLKAGMDEIAHIEELAWEYAPIDRNRRDLRGSEWIMYTGKNLHRYFQHDLDLNHEEIIANYRASLLEKAEKVKKAGTVVSTTLFLDQVIVEKVTRPNDFLSRPEIQLMPSSYLEKLSQNKDKHQVMFEGFQDFAPFKQNLDIALLWALKEKEVCLVLGTDSGTGGMGLVPGVSVHDELKTLVDAGFTPYEALASGTVIASKVASLMTGQDDFGTISPGKRADLVLLGNNPLSSIDHVKQIEGVMAAGRWYDKETINGWENHN